MAFFSWEDVLVGIAHEYLSSIPRAHVKTPGWWCMLAWELKTGESLGQPG